MPSFANGCYYTGDVSGDVTPPVYTNTHYVSEGDVDEAERLRRMAYQHALEARHALTAQRRETRRADSAVPEAEALARRYWTGEQANIDLHGEEEKRYTAQAGRITVGWL